MHLCCAVLGRSVVSDSLRPRGLQSTGLLSPCDSSGKNTGVGCHALLRGIFQTLGLNPDLPHCRRILYRLSHQEYTLRKTRLFLWAFHLPTRKDILRVNSKGWWVRKRCLPGDYVHHNLLHQRWIVKRRAFFLKLSRFTKDRNTKGCSAAG